jgi:hypothetical protein
MRTLQVILYVTMLAACANLHRYDGTDAALISRLCGSAPSIALDGKRYVREAGITAVDGNLPGTGVSCDGNHTYRVNPQAKQLTFFVFYQEPGARYAYMAYPQLNVALRPNIEYLLETTFDGTKIQLQLKDSKTGVELAQTQTTDVKRQSASNAVIPILVK